MSSKNLNEVARRVVFPQHYNTKSDEILQSIGKGIFGSKSEARKQLFPNYYNG